MRILFLQRLMNLAGTQAASDYFQVDLPDAALDIDIEGDIRVATAVVYV